MTELCLREILRAELDGRALQQQDVVALELLLPVDGLSIEQRLKLLAYYNKQAQRISADHALLKHCNLTLWFIEHEPLSRVSRCNSAIVDKFQNPESYELCRAAWLNQLERNQDAIEVYLNVAKFLQRHEPLRSISILERARNRCLPDYRVYRNLAESHLRLSSEQNESDFQTSTDLAEQNYLHYLNIRNSRIASVDLGLAANFFRMKQFEKAASYSRFAAEPVQYEVEPEFFSHKAFTVLGLISLAQNDLPKAIYHLNRSVTGIDRSTAAKESPDLRLVDALIERGENASVLFFLRTILRVCPSRRAVVISKTVSALKTRFRRFRSTKEPF